MTTEKGNGAWIVFAGVTSILATMTLAASLNATGNPGALPGVYALLALAGVAALITLALWVTR